MHWRIHRLILNLKTPIVVQATESEEYCDRYKTTRAGGIVDTFMFIHKWYNDDSGYRVFVITLLGFIKFKFKPSQKWATDRSKERIKHKEYFGVWPESELPYEYLLDYYNSEYNKRNP